MFALTDMFNPLDVNIVATNFPSIAASHGASTTSADYAPISTLAVINAMAAENMALHHAQIAKVRKPEKRGYEKHILRFRSADAATIGEGAPEVVMINSHDGSSSWQLFAGYVRFICANGLFMGSAFEAVKVRHVGAATLGKVIDGTYRVISEFDAINDRVESYRAKQLSADAVWQFERDAASIRLGDQFAKRDAANRLPALNTARRGEDVGSDLWSTFNRVQENIMRPQRGNRLRAIKSIDGSAAINRALCDLADAYLAA